MEEKETEQDNFVPETQLISPVFRGADWVQPTLSPPETSTQTQKTPPIASM